jgi:cobalamin biosynthesis protein CbiG
MRSALQIAGAAMGAPQHVGDRIDVPRLARVTRAHEGDLRLRVAKVLDASAGREGQRLQWLQRASREGERVGITCRVQNVAVAIDDRNRAEMDAFDDTSARDLAEGHGRR